MKKEGMLPQILMLAGLAIICAVQLMDFAQLVGRPWASAAQTGALANRICQRFSMRGIAQERTRDALLVHITCDDAPAATFALRWDEVQGESR